jgi:hypothetical protein
MPYFNFLKSQQILMLRGTLTTEEWKTEQQLCVEAVSVNFSEPPGSIPGSSHNNG